MTTTNDGDSDANDRERDDEAVGCCSSCGGEGEGDAGESAVDRWLPPDSVIDADLPADVKRTLERFHGEGAVETLGDWAERIRQQSGGGSIAVADLCHADEPSAHWGEMDGERYHFQCFYDAVALSALADRPVDIRTECPDGTVIEARASGTDDLTVTPEDAVVSFGVAVNPERPGHVTPTVEDVYAAVCPYVKAFPDREAYDRWAASVPAATVATSLGGATALAAALVE